MEMHKVKPIITITKEDLVSSNKLKEINKVLNYYKQNSKIYTKIFKNFKKFLSKDDERFILTIGKQAIIIY